MAFQQNISGLTMNYGSVGDVSCKQMRNSGPHPADKPNGCFDCNICLDSSHDPVVTLCGHLYCWPCIYEWLRVSVESDDHSKCPVCKSYISTSSLIPLYGRGLSEPKTKKPNQLDSIVPNRPPVLGMNVLLAATNQQNHQNPFQPHNRAFPQHQYFPRSLTGPSSTSFYSPTINMVGELVFAWMFGNLDTYLFAYPYSRVMGNGRPRLRRQEMLLDKSLNRVSIFLFCCVMLCLILF